MKARGPIPKIPNKDPWTPVGYETEDAAAVQAVVYGRASEDQQRRALKFIIEVVCARDDQSYRSGKPDDTAFAEGKRYVGNQIVKFSKLNLAALRGKQTEQGETPKE